MSSNQFTTWKKKKKKNTHIYRQRTQEWHKLHHEIVSGITPPRAGFAKKSKKWQRRCKNEKVFIAQRVSLTCKVHICGIAILLNEPIFGRVHFKRWYDTRKVNGNSRAIIMHHYVERGPATVHCPLTEWQSYYIHFIMLHIILQSVPPPRFFRTYKSAFLTADYFLTINRSWVKWRLDC